MKQDGLPHFYGVSCFQAQLVLNFLVHRMEYISEYNMSEVKWKAVEQICRFLQAGAVVTVIVGGKKYITLLASKKHFEKLRRKCEIVINDRDPVLLKVGKTILKNLNTYTSRMCTTFTNLNCILDPYFSDEFPLIFNARRNVLLLSNEGSRQRSSSGQ